MIVAKKRDQKKRNKKKGSYTDVVPPFNKLISVGVHYLSGFDVSIVLLNLKKLYPCRLSDKQVLMSTQKCSVPIMVDISCK